MHNPDQTPRASVTQQEVCGLTFSLRFCIPHRPWGSSFTGCQQLPCYYTQTVTVADTVASHCEVLLFSSHFLKHTPQRSKVLLVEAKKRDEVGLFSLTKTLDGDMRWAFTPSSTTKYQELKKIKSQRKFKHYSLAHKTRISGTSSCLQNNHNVVGTTQTYCYG